MRRRFTLSALALISALLGGSAVVADPGQPTAPAAEVPLFEGLSRHHHPVTTSSPLAQRYFDQGLRWLYAFNHDEARRSFEEAARLDPELAMAHWGVALSLGPNLNLPMDPAREEAARAAVQRAQAIMAHASPAERDYIRALAVRHARQAPESDRRAQDLAYANAMRALAASHPEDLDAATLFAEALMDLRPWDLWTRAGEPQPGTLEIVATLESVLARDPDHLGANHYYIHAVEASPHPERALPSADRLGDLAPAAGHLVHMAAHIYMRAGRYGAASDANARGVAADRAYLAAVKPSGFYALMYVPHNLQFLAVSTAFEGRRAASEKAAREAAAAAPEAHVADMPMLESFRAAPYFSLVRFAAWDALLAEPAPPETQRFTSAIHLWSRGVALARLGRVDEAAAELARLEQARARVPEEIELLGNNRAVTVLTIAARALTGEVAAARGDLDAAVASLREAVAIEDTLAYGEPPDWPIPARHALGAALLDAGRAAEAEAAYRADLARNPENGWALSGLSESLRRQGRALEAEAVEARLQRAFARADVALRGGAIVR
jgi:tetratricopeptide (TPR) repeat protein